MEQRAHKNTQRKALVTSWGFIQRFQGQNTKHSETRLHAQLGLLATVITNYTTKNSIQTKWRWLLLGNADIMEGIVLPTLDGVSKDKFFFTISVPRSKLGW